MPKPKLKQFEVKVQYTGTLTYVVKARTRTAAIVEGRRRYDRGVDPDNLMTDWERVDKITAELS